MKAIGLITFSLGMLWLAAWLVHVLPSHDWRTIPAVISLFVIWVVGMNCFTAGETPHPSNHGCCIAG